MVLVCKTKRQPGRTLGEFKNLTTGKHYVMVHETNVTPGTRMFLIEDDDGDKVWYPGDNFIVLEDLREEKLKELGI